MGPGKACSILVCLSLHSGGTLTFDLSQTNDQLVPVTKHPHIFCNLPLRLHVYTTLLMEITICGKTRCFLIIVPLRRLPDECSSHSGYTSFLSNEPFYLFTFGFTPIKVLELFRRNNPSHLLTTISLGNSKPASL